MTTPALITDLQRDEGCRLTAYPDPLSGADPWTIGYGHTGSDVCPGMTWTQDEADVTLAQDVADVEAQLDGALPWWRTLDDVRQDVLANMGFNIGVAGLLGFHNTLAYVEGGNYGQASANMLLSRWASEVGDRAQRLAFMMRTGSRPS